MRKNGIISHHVGPWQFLPIPKNASTSIIAAMYGLDATPEEIHRQKPRPTPFNEKTGTPFCVLRDPYDRFVSTWWDKMGRDRINRSAIQTTLGADNLSLLTFAQKVREVGWQTFPDRHLDPQTEFVPMPYKYVKFLRQWDLSYDWFDHGLANEFGPLPMLNASKYREKMNWKVFEIVGDIYGRDYQMIWEGTTK